MNNEWKMRTGMLIGESGVEVLASKHVAVFGIGGVGSYAVEALARAGVGFLDLTDNDTYSQTNINRQLYATTKTIGQPKVMAAQERISIINPSCYVKVYPVLYLPETADTFDMSEYDYVLDCIDNVSGKLELITRCAAAGVPVISAMGAGNKLHPELFEISDISKTSVCPLAKVMRHELKLRGVSHLKVVYSKEIPVKPLSAANDTLRRSTPGSISFTPSVMGLLMAGQCVRDLLN